MTGSPNIARTAALIGDPARAAILLALMRGQALTASELAAQAGVAMSTASSHLAQLEAGALIAARRQGRHKYFTLAGEGAAQVIEALMGFAGDPGRQVRPPGPRDPGLRAARVCYNHLAGDRGVQLYDSLVARGYLAETVAGLALTEAGWAFAAGFGITPGEFAAQRPPLSRACLDWSVRRSHLGGRLGRAFLQAIESRDWARRVAGTRIVRLTPSGQRAFDRAFPPLDGAAGPLPAR